MRVVCWCTRSHQKVAVRQISLPFWAPFNAFLFFSPAPQENFADVGGLGLAKAPTALIWAVR